jgi:hypothetical protein
MFERFTERARQIVVLAQDEARYNNNREIDVCHLVGGLIREEEGMACRIIEILEGVDDAKVVLDKARATYPPKGDAVTVGQIPFTAPARKCLEYALREALSLGHNYIGTEHVLLGIARTGAVLGHDEENVRNETVRMLMGSRRTPEAAAEASRHAHTILARDVLNTLDNGFALVRTLVEAGFPVTLTSFGSSGMDGRIKRPRFRVNVTYERTIQHSELVLLAQVSQQYDYAMEFSQRHGLTFRPTSDPETEPITVPTSVANAATAATITHSTLGTSDSTLGTSG